MTGSQRRWHLRLWIILGALTLLGFSLAILNRPPQTPAGPQPREVSP